MGPRRSFGWFGPHEIFLALLAVLFVAPIADYDIWWHLAAGRYFCQHGLVNADPFSWLAQGRPWVTHEWLFEILAWKTYDWLGGEFGLVALQYLLKLFPFILWWRECRRRRYAFPAALGGGLFLLALLNNGLLLRPHLFTYAFTIWLTIYLRRSRRGGVAVPLLYLWANLHAGFAAGLIVLGAAVLCPPGVKRLGRRRLALVFLIALAAAACTPIGPKLLLYPLGYLGETRHHRYLEEWQRPDLLQEPAFVISVIALVVVFVIARRKRPFDLILAGVFLAFSLSSKRYFPMLGAATVMAVTGSLNLIMHRGKLFRKLVSRYRKFATPARAIPAIPILVMVMVVGLHSRPFSALIGDIPGYPIASGQFPVLVAERLARLDTNRLSTRVFNSYHYGGYLMFQLDGQYQTGMDGRADIFTDQEMAEYQRVINGEPGWEEYLDRNRIDIVIFDQQSGLAAVMPSVSGVLHHLPEPGEELPPDRWSYFFLGTRDGLHEAFYIRD